LSVIHAIIIILMFTISRIRIRILLTFLTLTFMFIWGEDKVGRMKTQISEVHSARDATVTIIDRPI
jgi:hypothetical protein